MKIKYSKVRLNSNYQFGVTFVIAGIIMTIVFTFFNTANKFELDAAGFGLFGGGCFSLLIYYFEKKKQYLTLKNGVLTKNTLIPKKINLKDITSIKKFAGDYILKSNSTEFVIDTQIIDFDSLNDLTIELEQLNIEWT